MTESISVEMKFTGDDPEAGTITGVAAVYDVADRKQDIFVRGCFSESLAQHARLGTTPAMLAHHDPTRPCGVWLSFSDTDVGLNVTGRVNDFEMRRAIKAREIQALSVGIIVQKSSRDRAGRRVIERCDLLEISPVTTPAVPAARILTAKGGRMEDVETAAVDGAVDVKGMIGPLETKINDLGQAVAGMTGRIDGIEKIARRPGASPETKADNGAVEVKALASFARTGNDLEMKAASTVTDPAGGFLVLPTLDTTIRKVARDVSPLRSLANVVTITSDSYEVLVDATEAEAAWVSEVGSRDETNAPTLVKVSIPVHEMYAAPRATQKLLDDSPVNVANWLTGSVADRFSRSESSAFVSGDGVGKPAGFLSLLTDTAEDFTRTWGKLQHVMSGHATQVTADALVNMALTLRVPYRSNARWLMSRSAATVVRQIKDSTGRYLWGEGQLNDGQPGTLLGFPVALSEDMPAIAAGNLSIALGDWKAGYTIADRHGVRLIRDELTAKPYVVFYAYTRVGGSVVDCNAIKLMKIGA